MFFHKKDNKKKITKKKDKKSKSKKLLGFGGGKKKKGKKGSYIDQLHLQPVYEDALCDALPQMLQDEDERYIKADPKFKIIYLLALTNELIDQTDLKNNLGDLKTALNLSDSDGDVPGSIYNASFDIDLDPEPDPDGNVPTEDLEQIVFLPTMNTLDVLSTITDPNQKYEVVTLPSDLNRDNLSDNYEQGAINPPLLDDNSNAPITKTLAEFEQFVDTQTNSSDGADDTPADDGGYEDDGYEDDGAGYDDTGNYDDGDGYDDTEDQDDDSQDTSQPDYDDSTPDEPTKDELPDNEPAPDENDDDDDFGLSFDDDDDANDGINLDDAGEDNTNDVPFPDDDQTDESESTSLNSESNENDENSDNDDLSLKSDDSDTTNTEKEDTDFTALNSLGNDDEGIDLDDTEDPDDEPATVIDDDEQQDQEKPTETVTSSEKDTTQANASEKKDKQNDTDLSALDALNNVDADDALNLDDAGSDDEQATVVDNDLSNNDAETSQPFTEPKQEQSDNHATSLVDNPANNDTENKSAVVNNTDPLAALNNDNLNNYQQPQVTQQAMPQVANQAHTYMTPVQTTPVSQQSTADQFDQLLKQVVPVNPVDYIKALKLKLDDDNEPFVYANHEDNVLYQLLLTEQDLREADIDEKAIGSLTFAINNGQKYGNIQGSATTGSFTTDLSDKHIIFMPNAYTLDVLQDVFQDAKFTIVTMPDDITVQNFDNYQALHQINIPINQMGATQMRLSIRGFKDYINKIKADNKRIENAKPAKSDKIIINVDNPTNLDEIGSGNEKPPIGAENEAAVKQIIGAYMPRINELLDSIKTPAFGIDPQKDTDPEIISSKQLYNDTLKADVEQIKSNIRAKIVDRITRSIRDVTDPNVFSENYPQVDQILHEKFLNKESIQKAIDEETSAINQRYAVKRRNMIAKNIQAAKDDFQKTETPKQNKEIENAKQKIRDLHNDAYLTAVNSVLAKQRDAHRDQIGNDIDNIITQAQSDVSRGKDHISENTRTYLSELMRTIKTNRMIKQQLSSYVPQNPIPAQPVPNNSQKEMEEKIAGIRMASEASQREKDATIEELRRQLAESKQRAIQAQAAAEKANADRTALENERNQYKSTVQILQNQAPNAKPDKPEPKPEPEKPSNGQSDPSVQAEIDELNQTSVEPIGAQTEQERQEERDTSDIDDQLQDSIGSLINDNLSDPDQDQNPSDSSQGFSLDNY